MKWKEPTDEFTVEEILQDMETIIKLATKDSPSLKEVRCKDIGIFVERNVYTDTIDIQVKISTINNLKNFINTFKREMINREYTVETDYGLTAVLENIKLVGSSTLILHLNTELEQITELI